MKCEICNKKATLDLFDRVLCERCLKGLLKKLKVKAQMDEAIASAELAKEK